jgi:AcrR family transcriptional regulator
MAKPPVPQSLSVRKKPAQSRSAATYEAIVEAAARILERSGHARFTTNEVADLAGVSIGSLYQYFPNKDAVTRALMEREQLSLVLDVEDVSTRMSGRSAMEALVLVACRRQLLRNRLAAFLEGEERRLPVGEEGACLQARLELAARNCLRSCLRPGPDQDVIIDDVLAIILGMVDAAGSRGESRPDALAARVLRAAMSYVAATDRA